MSKFEKAANPFRHVTLLRTTSLRHCHGYCQYQPAIYRTGTHLHDWLSPEEERAGALDIELTHIKRKYGGDWMKYYRYHLDAAYDDAGNPYNYGFSDDDEEDEDNWWN